MINIGYTKSKKGFIRSIMYKNRRNLLYYIYLILLMLIVFPYFLKEYRQAWAVTAYSEFVEGKRIYEGEDLFTFTTPVEEQQYDMNYFIVDSTGDGIPELHIRGQRYTIFTLKNNEMTILESFCASSAGRYYLLKNGMIVYNAYVKNNTGSYYYYFMLDDSGNHVLKLSFGWEDFNNNCRFDNNDLYEFNGEVCTMEVWFEKTKEYLDIDDGKVLVRNEARWIAYCEAK